MMWMLLASVANAQWYETKIKDDYNGIAVVGVALKQWRPTDEVYFAIEERLTTGTHDHAVGIARWECLTSNCSSVNAVGTYDRLGGDLRHDQYLHPSMAIKKLGPDREVNVATRGRWTSCANAVYDVSSATADITKYLDVTDRRWDTNLGHKSSGLVRADSSDAACEDSTRSYSRFDDNKELHVAYDWAETPDVSSGPSFIPSDVFITSNGTHTMADRHFTEDGPRLAPTFDFYTDDNGDQVRAVAFHDDEKDTAVDFVDFSGVVEVFFDRSHVSIWHPSIEVNGDRVHLVNADSQKIDYRECLRSSNSDCNTTAEWSLEELANDADEASIVVDGKRLFIVFSESGVVKVASKCSAGTSWTVETPRNPAANKSQMLFSGRPYAVVNKIDNILHLAFIENQFGNMNENTGEAWWLRRTYTDCP